MMNGNNNNHHHHNNGAVGGYVTRVNLRSSNLVAEWNKFKSQFGVYTIAKGLARLDENEQVANMLLLMGPDCLPIFDQFEWRRAERRTVERTIEKFDTYFQPVRNLIYERSIFNRMVQTTDQPISDFITAVQTQSAYCEYGAAIKDELVRDRIVVGIRDPQLRQYLIDIEDLTLNVCVRRAKQYTTQREQMKELDVNTCTSADPNIDAVGRGEKSHQTRGRGRGRGRGNNNSNTGRYQTQNTGGYQARNTGGYQTTNPSGYQTKNTGGYQTRNTGGYQSQNPGGYQSQNTGGYQSQNTDGYQSQNTGGYQSQKCFYCNKGYHPREKCPAKDTTCNRCHQTGHWANSKACKDSQYKPQDELSPDNYAQDVDDGMEGLFLGQN
jgi:hypothetical protein